MTRPLIQKVDCIRLYVTSLEAGLTFYRDQLGLALIWRTEQAVGLRLPNDETEIVLHTEPQGIEIDLNNSDNQEMFIFWWGTSLQRNKT